MKYPEFYWTHNQSGRFFASSAFSISTTRPCKQERTGIPQSLLTFAVSRRSARNEQSDSQPAELAQLPDGLVSWMTFSQPRLYNSFLIPIFAVQKRHA